MRDVVHLDDQDLDALADRVATKVLGALRGPEPEPTPPELLTKAELAHALRRSTPTVDRWANEGMPFNDMGTYRLYNLETCRAWVAGRPRPGRPVKTQPPGAPPSALAGVELRTRARRA